MISLKCCAFLMSRGYINTHYSYIVLQTRMLHAFLNTTRLPIATIMYSIVKTNEFIVLFSVLIDAQFSLFIRK